MQYKMCALCWGMPRSLPAVLNEPQFVTSGMALPWVVARQNRQTLMPQS
jgi:hypothetical protein